MNESIKECSSHVLHAISKPEVRHTMHYECGLYADSEAGTPLACVRANNDFVMPVIKIAAIIGGTMLACTLLKSAVHLFSIKSQNCCKPLRH